MIHKKTVLILGAGASQPYGYPTGVGLKQTVCQELENVNNKYKQLQQLGFKVQEIDQFRRALFFSGKMSIDSFLEHRQEFENIGKVAIAAEIIPREDINILFQEGNSRWYQVFYKYLNSSFSDFEKNEISIITFNYDRSFEQFLFTAIQNTYNKSATDCAELFRKLRISHVYGKLGDLPCEDVTNGREYKGGSSPESIKKCSEMIKIIHENDLNSFEKAYEWLDKAEKIYFLGFGYDPLNLKRLKISTFKGKDIRGTAFGLSGAEMSLINAASGSVINFMASDALSFFNYIILD